MKNDLNLLQDFESLLSAAGTTEQIVQDFIEKNTRLFYPPHQLNHGVHLELLISKFQLDTTLTTDFAYLTKSSAVWWLVLLELEHPLKPLFTKNGIPTAELNAAIHQVDTWRTFIKRNANEVIRKVNPLRKPFEDNKVIFKYALIVGRTSEFEHDQAKVDAFEELQRDDFRVLTYESLIHAYQNKPNSELDIVSQRGQKFGFKHRHLDDTKVFAWLTQNDLHLDKDDVVYYKGSSAYRVGDFA